MPFRLLHFSDPHFGTAVPAQAERLVSLSHELKPDFILISGDFSMRARVHELEAARDWLAQLPKPYMTIPGNHDTPLFNQLGHRFFMPFRRYKTYINEELEPVADLAPGRLVGLNSSTPFGSHLDWSRGFLTQQQCLEMPDKFEGCEGLRLVSFHHPLLRHEHSKRQRIAPLLPIQQALDKARVDLVFSGHFHQSIIRPLDLPGGKRSCLVSQASTACSYRLKEEPAGFHCLDLELAGEARARFTPYAWDRDDYRPVRDLDFVRQGSHWRAK